MSEANEFWLAVERKLSRHEARWRDGQTDTDSLFKELVEEVGELSTALRLGTSEEARIECISIAARAVKLAELV